MKVAIIGAGAAGCFCAVNIRRMHRDCDVEIFEASAKPLAKVAVTGGGRCNLTNSFRQINNLSETYPRGDKLMRRVLSVFSQNDVMAWFEREGVALVTQDDECVFPKSQDAMEIVETLLRLCHREGVKIHLRSRVYINKVEGGYSVGNQYFDKVVVTVGGCNKVSKLDFLKSLNLEIVPPVPSLFTFNIEGNWHQRLMGTVVEDAVVTLSGTKHRSQGAILLTHWGMSGPAILKLSSHAARHLAENHYKGMLTINWCGGRNEEEMRQYINSTMSSNAQKLVTNVYPTQLTQAHWAVMLEKAGVPATQRWGALNKKHINRLVTTLTADVHHISGRCHFKEEFVTAGGIALSNINQKTMESKRYPGLFFAGEVLDVDAITGGFNLQAAWSMAYVVAQTIGKETEKAS